MMKKDPTGHTTAEKILKTAETIFATKGFSGTSINDIADQAKIPKSLIYHHFGSKEDLWKAVKTNLLQTHTGKDIAAIEFPMDSFKNFLKSVITLRFEFYDKNPSIARLISWQRLEDNNENIKGVSDERLTSLTPQITEFQRRGEVRPDLNADMVSYLIMTAASTPFIEKPIFFQGTEGQRNKQTYLEMIIDGLYMAFAKQSRPQQRGPRIYAI